MTVDDHKPSGQQSETARQGEPVNAQAFAAQHISNEPIAAGRLGKSSKPTTRLMPGGLVGLSGVPAVNLSNGLFGLAAIAALGAGAALAGLGPFAAPANAVGGTAPVGTAAPTVAVAQTFVPRLIPVGSGTISFTLPPRYGSGAATITEYLCQNATLAPDNPNPGVPPPSGLGPEEPAIGVRGLVFGNFGFGRTSVPSQTFFAFFTATRSFIGFQDVSLMPAMRGGSLGVFEKDKRVAGTADIHTGSGGAGQFTGTVTADLTCTTGPTAAPAVVPVAPAAQVKTTDAPASPSGNSPWPALSLAMLAIAAAAGGLATRERASHDLHTREKPGTGTGDPRQISDTTGATPTTVSPPAFGLCPNCGEPKAGSGKCPHCGLEGDAVPPKPVEKPDGVCSFCGEPKAGSGACPHCGVNSGDPIPAPASPFASEKEREGLTPDQQKIYDEGRQLGFTPGQANIDAEIGGKMIQQIKDDPDNLAGPTHQAELKEQADKAAKEGGDASR